MPMSYLYGKRFVGPITPLVLELREELFLQPYNEINWKKVRHLCAKVSFDFVWNTFPFPMNMLRMHETHFQNCLLQEDLYYPHPLIQDMMWDSLYICTEPLLTRWPFNKLRKKALEVTMKHIHYEDENSRYITIGCVEKVIFLQWIMSIQTVYLFFGVLIWLKLNRCCVCFHVGLKIQMGIISRSTLLGFQIIYGLEKME